MVAAEVPQSDTLRQAIASELGCYGGQHDLPSMSGSGDAGGPVHVHPDVIILVHLWCPGVDANAHSHPLTPGPRIGFQISLSPYCRPDRSFGRREHDEEAVTLGA